MPHLDSKIGGDLRRTDDVLPEERIGALEFTLELIEDERELLIEILKGRRDIPEQTIATLNTFGVKGEETARILQLWGEKILKSPEITPDAVINEETESEGGIEGALSRLVARLTKELEKLGGSTRENTKRVLVTLDLERYWYAKAFDALEGMVFEKTLFTDLEPPLNQYRSLDIGSGVARASMVALKAVKEKFGPEGAKEFAKGMHAVDIMQRFVDATREKLCPMGVPSRQVFKQDFLRQFPPSLQQENIHAAWAPMHTLWHCTTRIALRRLLSNVSRALSPGGRFLFDSVGLYHHQGVPVNPNTIAQNNDLSNIYDVLVRLYHQRHIARRMSSQSTFRAERFPITDCTAKVGSYTREVLTRPYIEQVLGEAGINLRFLPGDQIFLGENPFNMFNREVYSDEEAETLGMQWIDENELREFLEKEIAFRLHQEDINRLRPDMIKSIRDDVDPHLIEPEKLEAYSIIPLYAIKPEAVKEYESEIQTVTELHSRKCRAALKKIARKMVLDYVQMYFVLEKPTAGAA